MRVCTTQDHESKTQFQHFIASKEEYKSLLQIERQSKARALKTEPIIILDTCNGIFGLTVMDQKI